MNLYNPIKSIQLRISQDQLQNVNSSTIMKFIGTLDFINSIAMYVHGIASSTSQRPYSVHTKNFEKKNCRYTMFIFCKIMF